MVKESVIRINYDISESPEDNQLTPPRCSTPIFDGSYVSPLKTSSEINREKNNDVRLYREWKLRLQRGKPRIFKVRGCKKKIKSNAANDCSIISGHFESEVNIVGQATPTATSTATATPVYQMWFPFGYPGFWTPAHHGCQHQNHLWNYGTAQLQPHYQIPTTFFGPTELFFANFCQRIRYQPAQVLQCNANYPTNEYNPNIHWPQGTHYQVNHHNHNHNLNHPFHPTYSAAPNYPQFLNRGTVI